MSIAQLTALYTTAAAALDSGDYAAAIKAGRKALVLVGASPSLMEGTGQGTDSIAWRSAADIKTFIAECRGALRETSMGSSGVFGQSKVRYERPDE